MADQFLNLNIKVNKDTGAIDVIKNELAGLKNQSTQVTEANKHLSDSISKIYSAAVALGAVKFFKSAIDDAVEYEKSLRVVTGQLKAMGLPEARKEVQEWANAIEKATAFNNDQAIKSLGSMLNVTKDLATAQRLTMLAFDISAQSGKDYNTVLEAIRAGYAGQDKALRPLKTLLGDTNKVYESTNDLLEDLERRFQGSAASARGLDIELVKQQNAFRDISREIGERVLPAVTFIGKGWLQLFDIVKVVVQNIKGLVIDLGEIFIGVTTKNIGLIKSGTEGLYRDLGKVGDQYVDDLRKQNETTLLDYQKTIAQKSTFQAQTTKTDTANEKDALNSQLAHFKSVMEQEVQSKQTSDEQKLASINRYVEESKAKIDAAEADHTLTHEQAEAARTKIDDQAGKDRQEINERYVSQTAKRWEDFTKQYSDQWQIAEAAAETAISGISAGFGTSVAKMIVSGESFKENFGKAMKSLAEQVIADIIRMEVEMQIFRGLAAVGLGNPFAGAAAGAGATAGAAGAGAGAGGGIGAVAGAVAGAGAVYGAYTGLTGALLPGNLPSAVSPENVVTGTALGDIASAVGGLLGGGGPTQEQIDYLNRFNANLSMSHEFYKNLQNQYLTRGLEFLSFLRDPNNGIPPTQEAAYSTLENYKKWKMGAYPNEPIEQLYEFPLPILAGQQGTQRTWKDGQPASFEEATVGRPYPMAEGGIVTKPTMAMIGESGPEAVIPLGKKSAMGGISVTIPTTINVAINPGTTQRQAEELVKAIAEQLKRKTPEAINMALRVNNLVENYSGRST